MKELPTNGEQQSVLFADLNLPANLIEALNDVGYETPSPIQAQTIPHILEGRDIVGQAQTGTGKTAAFALPLLARLDISRREPQVLVLTPTRELAIQVAEAMQRYASRMKDFHILPIYGGQAYEGQLRQLRRGVHVVVGTPGRVMDHIKRGTLDLNNISTFVLDEADEMLRMGFIDDVRWILDKTPDHRQIALFSATMPPAIRSIAITYLKDPIEITVKAKTKTVAATRQRYWLVRGVHKLDALTRILEAEPFEGMIIFVRTRTATIELAEKLEARGYAAAPLNGEIPQKQRERTIERLKAGKLDIIVATDVAARGLDVERISHVINYDVPYDTEAYIHRIGRTGRAGRSGEAILFIAPRERRMLTMIERATRQRIELMELPSTKDINDKRIAAFKQRIIETQQSEDTSLYLGIIEQLINEQDASALEIAAALAKMMHKNTPLLLENLPQRPPRDTRGEPRRNGRQEKRGRRSRNDDIPMEPYRIEVGFAHGVKPGNIVGAIANEAGLDSKFIGRIDIRDDHSIVDLPEGMPRDLLRGLKHVRISGQQMRISRMKRKPGAFKENGAPKSRRKSRLMD